MTTHPTSPILPLESYADVESIELPHRGSEIAFILRECFDSDREYRRADAFIDSAFGRDPETGEFPRGPITLTKPTALIDLFCWLPTPFAELATVLYGPVSKLVDACLDVDDEWRFDNWSAPKQAARLRSLFEEAGIGDRFVTPQWTEPEMPDIESLDLP